MLRQAVKEAHLCGGPDRRWLTASLHFIYDIKELPVRACLFPQGFFPKEKRAGGLQLLYDLIIKGDQNSRPKNFNAFIAGWLSPLLRRIQVKDNFQARPRHNNLRSCDDNNTSSSLIRLCSIRTAVRCQDVPQHE